MQPKPEPCKENAYLSNHAELLICSYRRLTGKNLVEPQSCHDDMYRALYEAPYGVVSHGIERDPIFNYANRKAQELFEMSWSEFVALPSRLSAEPVNANERQKLLARVSEYGFVDGYSGIRISVAGNRFRIDDTTVWNLANRNGLYCGQAAVFYRWSEA